MPRNQFQRMVLAAVRTIGGIYMFGRVMPVWSVVGASRDSDKIYQLYKGENTIQIIFPNGKIFSHIKSFFIDFPVRESYTIDMRIISVESISEAVKNRRKQLGLTQSETAAMCNVGARFFSELENGKETLQMNKVLHCLEMLGINLYAVNREDDK